MVRCVRLSVNLCMWHEYFAYHGEQHTINSFNVYRRWFSFFIRRAIWTIWKWYENKYRQRHKSQPVQPQLAEHNLSRNVTGWKTIADWARFQSRATWFGCSTQDSIPGLHVLSQNSHWTSRPIVAILYLFAYIHVSNVFLQSCIHFETYLLERVYFWRQKRRNEEKVNKLCVFITEVSCCA